MIEFFVYNLIHVRVYTEIGPKQEVHLKIFFDNIYRFIANKNVALVKKISASNHMFKRKIWDKFTEFTFLEFLNLFEFSKFQKMNEVNFSEISRINM